MDQIIKTPATQYYVVVDGHSWGTFIITEKGDLFINSDWGYWATCWRAFGTNFREFLSTIDTDYLMMNLLRNQLQFGGNKTITKRKEQAIAALFKRFQDELKKELYHPA